MPNTATSAIRKSLLLHTTIAFLHALTLTTALAQEAPTSPPAVQRVTVPGLNASAQILVDRWGVPHIYAASRDDAFFVQGFNAARDRLFQIDLWRRRGLGRLSPALGPAYVEQDRAARLFLYRGDMRREWRAYGREAERIATRFTAGINAYIDYLAAEPTKLPYEFRRLGYLPEKWLPEDVVRIRSHGLTRNLTAEVARAQVACKADLRSDRIRASLTPPWETKIPTGLDPCLPPDVLKVFTLATQAATIKALPGTRTTANGEGPPAALFAEANGDFREGSNNWVIAPAKSATGRAVMANDPHRALTTPSLRYIAHLSAPGMDVIGGGEPALPGISIGHNGTIAFGLTIFSIDQEDLYVYELNPDNHGQYRYRGKWENFVTREEEIAVRDSASVKVELCFSRHGPIIYVDKARNRAYGVRTGWLEPGMAPYFGSIDYMFAKDFLAFRRAMRHWGAPTENQVYADVRGNIGWVPGGLAPIRPNWDGLLPVPGDGRYEWAGFLSGDQLPSAYNPAKGWFATANELNLPADYPYRERKLGFEWPSNARYTRIEEVLSRPGKISFEDSLRLQNDITAVHARRLIALLKPLTTSDARLRAALDMLRGWDYVERSDSAAAALFEVWWSRYLGTVLKSALLSRAAYESMGAPDGAVLLEAMEHPERYFGMGAAAQRDQVLLHSLSLAYAETERLLGADVRSWQWGRLHRSLLVHPLSPAVDETARAKLNVGPFAKHGSAHVPNASGYSPVDFMQLGGPSFRIVVDVGHWDESRAINTPGQSGDPDSPHYRDLARKWLAGEYFPLLYSRARVEEATELRIELNP